ncbi:MAG: sigma-70 family RNA polymerase sigma factor [Chloroflexi bacterium]|nr:sigma-70 family RNA polymerase sigma factor [Chloroflexota bacterium]
MEDDNVLVARAQRGDTHAFAKLYDRHLDAIYRYVSLRVPSQQQAEDLTEDIFFRAWQNLKQYRPKRPFLHWLYRVAHNRIVDEQRRKHQQDVSLDALNDAGFTTTAETASPLSTVIAQEEIKKLRQALSTMTPDEQTLLSLRFFEDMSYDEIAPILGKSAGACRVLQHRALKKLADRLQPAAE